MSAGVPESECSGLEVDDIVVTRWEVSSTMPSPKRNNYYHFTLDVRIRNAGITTVNATRTWIGFEDRKSKSEPFPQYRMAPPTAEYYLGPDLTKMHPISHVIKPGEIDRFLLNGYAFGYQNEQPLLLYIIFNGKCQTATPVTEWLRDSQ